MKIARVQFEESVHWVEFKDSQWIILEGDPFKGFRSTERRIQENSFRFLSPIVPRKIMGIGANFPGEEDFVRDFPSFFWMPGTAVVPHGETVILPRYFDSVLAEGEVAVVLKLGGKSIPKNRVREHILGYTIANDLSGRDEVGIKDVPAAMKKGCDGFLPLGPVLWITEQIPHFQIETFVNGEKIQSGNTKNLLFSIEDCISRISECVTLEPGDLISLGTPPPKPKLVPGDSVRVSVSELGVLENRISKNTDRGL